MGDALDDGLHGRNVIQSCSREERVDFIHLRNKCVNGDVEKYLFNNYLSPVLRLDCVTGESAAARPWKQKRG